MTLTNEGDLVSQLVHRATQAHVVLMRGDVAAYRALIEPTDDFILMAPFGGTPSRGAAMSQERWEAVGRFFVDGKDSTLELVHAWCGTDMVVLAVIERAHVAVGGLPAQDWALRVTLVFRHENGLWLLAHRHADPLGPGITVPQAAALSRATPQ